MGRTVGTAKAADRADAAKVVVNLHPALARDRLVLVAGRGVEQAASLRVAMVQAVVLRHLLRSIVPAGAAAS